ncbi:TPA: BLUF domain-containing protein, partial [Klebsiella pneumoniae]|nr:BLUF domain-containing protein [Klebsiella pneumoniae]
MKHSPGNPGRFSSHFFQLLEGPEEQVQMIYRAICQDP